VIAIKKIQQIL